MMANEIEQILAFGISLKNKQNNTYLIKQIFFEIHANHNHEEEHDVTRIP